MTYSNCAGARLSRWRKNLLISTSLAAIGLTGATVHGPALAQESRPAAALPPVYVGSPDAARVRRAPQRATSARSAARNRPAAQAQPAKQPPSVNNQDARTGQVGYITGSVTSATKTNTPLLNVPQSVTVLTKEFIRDQAFTSIGEATRYVPGVIYHQGESHRDDLVIRGQRSNADFYTNGIRDDVQYFRDFYNLQRLEVLKGPNAMIFGRGGGGGVVNRVLKEADGTTIREVTVGGNSYPGARVTTDIGQAVNENWAFRLNAMYENSESYRDFVTLDRWAFNPTVTFAPTDTTTVKLSYEHVHDRRTVDRGIPSQLRPGGVLPQYPYQTSPSAFFGNPNLNYALADVDIGNAVIEHDFENGLTVKNATQIANYDKFYQNIYPGGGANLGAVNVAGTSSNLSAYNNETDRTNLFNQTDFTYKFGTGPIRHTVVVGGEVGRQTGLSYRQDGFFNNLTNTITIDPRNPTSYVPVTFRNIASGANNTYKLDLGAVYVQDQVEITRYLQIIGGLRFDHFDLSSTDRRTAFTIERVDNLVSPRLGVISEAGGKCLDLWQLQCLLSAWRRRPIQHPDRGDDAARSREIREPGSRTEVGYLAAPAIPDRGVRSRPYQYALSEAQRSRRLPDRFDQHQGLRGKPRRLYHGCLADHGRLCLYRRADHGRHVRHHRGG